MKHPQIQAIEHATASLSASIARHPVIHTINDHPEVRLLIEHHVFAVWDFVYLVNELNRRMLCRPDHAESADLLRSMRREGEGDDENGYSTYFSRYLAAMDACNADTQPIKTLLAAIKAATPIDLAVQTPSIPRPARAFVQQTFAFFDKPICAIAGAFVFGREAIIPVFFQALVERLIQAHCPDYHPLIAYLSPHITGEQLPKAHQILVNLCGNDRNKWQQAEQAAITALQAWRDFMTGINQAISHHKEHPAK
jgi:hypothetical protein